MSLIDLIKTHCLSDAQSGDWDAVANTLNSLTKEVYIGKVGGRTSLSALMTAGIDPNTVISQMRSVPMSSELLDTLIVSGVDWSDSLTAMVMENLVSNGKITQQTVNVMRNLSIRTVNVVTTTSEECQRAWLVNSCLEPVKVSYTLASIKLNNVTALLESEQIKNLTLQELQSRCDAISASTDGTIG